MGHAGDRRSILGNMQATGGMTGFGQIGPEYKGIYA